MATNLPDMNMVLFGDTGNGKSKTGNSILKRNCFPSMGMTDSVTKTVKIEEARNEDGRRLRVVDTPGVNDPNCTESIRRQMIRTMTDAMDHSRHGFHAVLLVFRFGVMSPVNKTIVENLPQVFGQKFLENHCIIIITFGDNFEKESEESGETFDDWCRKQGLYFQNLLEKCEKRILLFDNMTKDDTKRDEQRTKLIDMIVNFQFEKGVRLTKDLFQANLPSAPAQRKGCQIL